jgi:hypothetical protein
MIDSEDNRAMVWKLVATNNLHLPKKDTQDGMKKDLDAKIQQFLEFRNPYVKTQEHANDCYMPRRHGGEHMHKYLDGTAIRVEHQKVSRVRTSPATAGALLFVYFTHLI